MAESNIDPNNSALKLPWSEWTWSDLAHEAEFGSRGQPAVVESNRRVVEASERFNFSTTTQQSEMNTFTDRVVWLTYALFTLALIQFVFLLVKLNN